MRINIKQIFILLVLLIIIIPPVNYEDGYFYGSKDQVVSHKNFEGFKFIYFVLTSDDVTERRYNILTINYPFLILELIILSALFLFIYFGKTNNAKKNENKLKEINKQKFSLLIFTNIFFKKIFFYIKEQNRRSLFWATVAILTIVIYILEFFTGVSKLVLSLF